MKLSPACEQKYRITKHTNQMSTSRILGLYGDDYELHANALSVYVYSLEHVTKRHCYRFLLNLTPMG